MAQIVLVGGAFLGAWAWERVTPLLREHGHDVHPLTLTGAGDRVHLSGVTTLTTNADDIVNAITYADLHDVVLVAHSYAGAPATIAASRIPERIKRIVYVAAVLPEPGRSLFEQFGPEIEGLMRQTVRDGLIPLFSDEILDTWYGEHDLSAADRMYLRERGTGQPVAAYEERTPEDLSAVDKLPRTYIVCTGDPGEPHFPDGWDVDRIETGHWPMITRPAELAGQLSRWAQ